MNKREFLLATGGALLAGDAWSAAVATASPGASARMARDSVHNGSVVAWQERIGEAFEVVGEHGPGRLLLQRVVTHASDSSVDQFTLVFSVASGKLPSATHVLRHADHGILALYLDHAGVDEAGRALLRADCCRLL